MSAPPLVGVTTSEVRAAEDVRPVAEGEPKRREMALGLTYLKAIERIGGIPVVLPPLGPEAIDPLLDRLSGVLLSGGPDLDPKTYGQRAGENLGPTWPDLDFFAFHPIAGIVRVGAREHQPNRGGSATSRCWSLPCSLMHRG